ncbi:similar to CG12753-PA (predicted) [Rattus norvegicus]|uniref:Similar to CG12753-PA (Predicted) n=1 Tax=Rattus norvegicus TaxID=10116 RepID=A6K4J0_RAT|nr:similar to CG12753-PA (predicted) [Rattus norvegicus]
MRKIEMVIMKLGKLSEVATAGASVQEQNTTDEEKSAATSSENAQWSRPFLDMVYHALDSPDDDYHALFVLCLLYAMSHNKGMDPEKLKRIQLPVPSEAEKTTYNHLLAERLIRIMNNAAQPDGRIRLATLELSCLLLKQQVLTSSGCVIKDVHLACLEIKPMNVEYLMMDASILLPPTGTPLTGIDFVKRLPCGDVEKTRRAIRVFFMLRSLSLQLRGEPETQLPLTREEDLIKTDDVLDLNNSDLIACTVITKDGGMVQRFLAVDIYQMSLVEPDVSRLGWGVVKFAGLLQDMQVTGVEDDSRALNITIHKPASSPHSKPFPILQATFVFSDHIRCIIAKQRLAKGRIQARRMKMQRIAALLDLPIQPTTEVLGFGLCSTSSQHLPFRFYEQCRRGSSDPTVQRSVFASVDKVPGFAVAQCINQHSSPSLSSPSPPFASGSPGGSGSTSHCDSGGSSSAPSATQSPADAPTTPEQPQPHLDQSVIGNEVDVNSKPSKNSSARSSEGETMHLSPSLLPAQQPTISLLYEDTADTLSVESLTLVPPVDPHSLRALSGISQLPAMAAADSETPAEGAVSPEPAGPTEH